MTGEVVSLGFDVSVAQGRIDWPQLRAQAASPGGRVFCWAKATEGRGYVDPQFANNARGAREAGIAVGGYEFAHWDADPEECAEHTARVLEDGGFSGADLPPFVDAERVGASGSGVYPWLLRWCRHMRGRLGRVCPVYTGKGFVQLFGDPDFPELAEYPLILAAYVPDPARFVPRAWRDAGWSVWQETGDVAPAGKPLLHLPGVGGGWVNVDGDRMRGTVADFIARSLLPASTYRAPEVDDSRVPVNPIGAEARAEDALRAQGEVVTSPGTPEALHRDEEPPDTKPGS